MNRLWTRGEVRLDVQYGEHRGVREGMVFSTSVLVLMIKFGFDGREFSIVSMSFDGTGEAGMAV